MLLLVLEGIDNVDTCLSIEIPCLKCRIHDSIRDFFGFGPTPAHTVSLPPFS